MYDNATLNRISLCGAIASCFGGMGVDPGVLGRCFEREVSDGLAKTYGETTNINGFRLPGQYFAARDLSAGGSDTGKYLTSTQNLIGLTIEGPRPRSIVSRFGATILRPDIVSTIPRVTSSPDAVWLGGETVGSTPQDDGFGAITIRPYAVSTTVRLSRQMVVAGGAERDAVIKTLLRNRILEALDRVVFSGTGADGQPLGIMNISGIGAVSGTSLALAGLVAGQREVALSETLAATPGSTGYAAHPGVADLLMQRQKFAGASVALWEGELSDGTVAGAPAIASTAVPLGRLIFGDWSQLAIAEYDGGSIEIAVDPFTDFRSGRVTVRAYARFDVFLRYISAFTLFTTVS